MHLFRWRLLPPQLTEVDDFIDEKGWVSIIRTHKKYALLAIVFRYQYLFVEDFRLGNGFLEIIMKSICDDVLYFSEDLSTRSESGLLSWFGLGGGNDAEKKKPTAEQLQLMKVRIRIIIFF